VRFETSSGVKRHLVTPYDGIVADEYFPYTLNLRLDEMVDYYRHISQYAEMKNLATETVLRLIKGSDQVPERRDEFLDAAMVLNDWVGEGNEDIRQAPFLVNKLQIVVRRRALTSEERVLLRNLKHLGDPIEPASGTTAYGCSVLLGDKEEADFLLKRLEPQMQTRIREWPIWTLHDRGIPDHSQEPVSEKGRV